MSSEGASQEPPIPRRFQSQLCLLDGEELGRLLTGRRLAGARCFYGFPLLFGKSDGVLGIASQTVGVSSLLTEFLYCPLGESQTLRKPFSFF